MSIWLLLELPCLARHTSHPSFFTFNGSILSCLDNPVWNGYALHSSSPVSARCVWNYTPAAVPTGGHAWHWVGVLCLGRMGRGHVCTRQLCQPPAERCSTPPGG